MNSKPFTKRSFLTTSTATLCCLAGGAALAATPGSKTGLRIGIYDSRAIAIAAVNSATHKKRMDSVMSEYQAAKSAKDEKRMKELEARMKAKQRRQHEQGFSTGSVIDLMQDLKGQLPALAKELGVQVIVSKWEVVFQSPDIEAVDVTDRVVALFKPSEKALKWIHDIGPKTPIPIDELPDNLD